MTLLFLINGYWLALVLNLPLLAFNVKKYAALLTLSRPLIFRESSWMGMHCIWPFADFVNRILDNAHLLDATEIFRKLNVHKKVRIL